MAYTVKEIANLAGVSPRTIRYYDSIGLLDPASTGENGYRFYDKNSLLWLQQILFFRELDVPLKDIQEIMAAPHFNPVQMLRTHREELMKRSDRIRSLILTVDNTIKTIQGKNEMAENELFNGFSEEKYAEETKARWGDTVSYKESQKKWSSYSAAEKEEIKQEGGRITERMVGETSDVSPDDADVQAAIGDYLAYLNKYFYTCDAQVLKELADMWVADARFAVNYERIREGGSQFVRDAVYLFCDNQ